MRFPRFFWNQRAAAVDAELAAWCEEWQAHNREAQLGDKPWLQIDLSELGEELGKIEVEHFRAVCKAFKRFTGVGVDNWHPHLWAQLSDEGVRVIIAFLLLVEKGRVWPAQAGIIVYFLLAKPGGGNRPIGLLPTLVRVWESLENRSWKLGASKRAGNMIGQSLGKRPKGLHGASFWLKRQRSRTEEKTR